MKTFVHVVAAVVTLTATHAVAELPVHTREQLNALLWVQTSVEYRAAARQTFRDAARTLADLQAAGGPGSMEHAQAGDFERKPPAVVLDVDETVLDNSRYNARLVQRGTAFDPASWDAWVHARQANPVPGAAEFVRSARNLGYRVLYVSDRNCDSRGRYDEQGRSQDCPQRAATLDNLQSALGYRPAESELYLRFELKARDDSDKQARRQAIAQSFRIVMLLGDDVNDFIRRSDYSEHVHGSHWGARWFMLPNPLYGSWERAFPGLDAKYAGLTAWSVGDSTRPGPARVSIASWNLQWLADPLSLQSADFWRTCEARGWPNEKLRPDLPFCNAYSRDGIRSAADYDARKLSALRRALSDQAARRVDILAVQEVAGPAALAAVLPPGYETVCFTTRDDAQNLGYAVRTAARIPVACREVAAISLEHDPGAGRRLRRGLELSIELSGNVISLLNVHLKSGCPRGRMDSTRNDACSILQRQAEPLEQWVEQTAAAGRPFLIIGDWNRDLEQEVGGGFPARSNRADPAGPIDAPRVRNIFPEIHDGVPAASAMELAQVDRSAAANRACHTVLDQLVVSVLLKGLLNPASLSASRLPARLVAGPPGASDHCALETVLQLR